MFHGVVPTPSFSRRERLYPVWDEDPGKPKIEVIQAAGLPAIRVGFLMMQETFEPPIGVVRKVIAKPE
jgi:hypothetical protein